VFQVLRRVGLGGTLSSLRGGCDTGGFSSCSSRDVKLCCLIAELHTVVGLEKIVTFSSKSLGGGKASVGRMPCCVGADMCYRVYVDSLGGGRFLRCVAYLGLS
jgi:hypothetical protein